MPREFVEQYFNVQFRCSVLPAVVDTADGDLSNVPGYDQAICAYNAAHRIAEAKLVSFPEARISSLDAPGLNLAAYELCEAWPVVEFNDKDEPYFELPFYSNAKLSAPFAPAFESAMKEWLKEAGDEVGVTLEFVAISSQVTFQEVEKNHSIYVAEQ